MMLDRGIHLAYFDPATGHVPNPGMGISAYVFSDHMHYGWNPNQWRETEVLTPNNPVTRDTLDRMLDLPYVDNLYFRADWDRVQSAPGKLDLPPEWDWMMEAVESRGKRWSFRIMNSSRHSVNASSVPDFLRDELEFGSYRNEYRFGPERKFFPLYTPEYHARWRELLELFADRYDSHPLLEYVDISGYGVWGEGHHYGLFDDADTTAYNRHADNAEDAVGTLIEDHLRAFAQTPVAMTLHYLDYEAGVRALQNPRVWLRRDSFQPFASVTEYSATAFAVPGQAVIWETLVPSDTSMRAPMFTLERTVQRYLDFNAHYAAVGFNPWRSSRPTTGRSISTSASPHGSATACGPRSPGAACSTTTARSSSSRSRTTARRTCRAR